MKKKRMYDVVQLDAWNPKRKVIEKIEVIANAPYEVQMEDGKKFIYIFDLSPKIQKKIKKIFDYDNPSILPYSYVWDSKYQYFDDKYGVLDMELVKHIYPIYMNFVVSPLSNNKGSILKQFLCKSNKKCTIDVNAPLRIHIEGLHKNMPETWYGTLAGYSQPRFFGLFGNTLKIRTYNANNAELPFVWDRKVKLNKVTLITNGKFVMSQIDN